MRVPQPAGKKGSLKLIQGIAVPDSGASKAIRAALDLPPTVSIDWRSPRANDAYAECRDGDVLALLGLEYLRAELKAFWPERGPQWDAIGTASDGTIILVEAKAHAGELASSCAAGAVSLEKIGRALDAAKSHYGAPADRDWLRHYYQYANRLAHLKFFRDHGVDAHLVFVYFLGDEQMDGPASKEAWATAIDDCHTALGIPGDHGFPGEHDVFIEAA